ncbi:MAG TPA: hypothetical protein VFA51_00345, partial [Candidatus Udaeobacter sp.]|nr:hypothetical protein [Candidatus Udaeobacter sp.]
PSDEPKSAIIIASADVPNGTDRAARSKSAIAGREPAACTEELRLYAPLPSMGAGRTKFDLSSILTCAPYVPRFNRLSW